MKHKTKKILEKLKTRADLRVELIDIKKGKEFDEMEKN